MPQIIIIIIISIIILWLSWSCVTLLWAGDWGHDLTSKSLLIPSLVNHYRLFNIIITVNGEIIIIIF